MRAKRRPTQRSRNARCKRCKKVRKMWLHANYIWGGRVFSRNVKDEGKVCWICVIREVDPSWRPGMDIPIQLLDAKTQERIKAQS